MRHIALRAGTSCAPRAQDRRTAWHPGGVSTVDELVGEWLTLPDAAELLDVETSRVRRLIDEDKLLAVRRGDPVVRSVPAAMILDGEVVPHLPGTITVLRDAGFADEEMLTWLFTADETLPGRPIDQLRAGQRGEVRRRAQAMAF